MTEQGYKIVFYCPDTNLKINGEIYKTKGLGGGKTALIKLAKALRRAGNDVIIYAYTDGGTYDDVQYINYENLDKCEVDVFITFTGYKCDLSEMIGKDIKAKIKIVMIGGASPIKGLGKINFDFYYAISRYLKERVIKEWGLPYEKVISVEHGYDPEDIPPMDYVAERDMWGIIFASHPFKGLSMVIDIVRRLREYDQRFYLDVYGSPRLHHDEASDFQLIEEPWLKKKGMIGQLRLVQLMHSYGFMLHLTDYPDLASLVIQQAKKAGIINIVSNVGGNSELIENGYDGFLIDEHYMSDICVKKVIKLITYLTNDKEYAYYIRNNAMKHALTWDKIAKDWIHHWEEVLNKKRKNKIIISGYYGYKNLGDEAILSCIIKDIRSIDPNGEITVVSGDPFYTEKIHRVSAIPHDNFKLQTKAVEKSDLVILGGGGLFQDHNRIKISQFFEDHRYGITNYANLPLMAKIFQKPVVYYAQGVGPLFSKDSFLFSKWAFKLADFITVRDEYSYCLLTEFLKIDPSKISLSYDPTMKSDIPDKQRARALRILYSIPEDKKLIIVSVRSWINKTLEHRFIASLIEFLSHFLSHYLDNHIVFIPFYTDMKVHDNDINISEKVAKALPADKSTIVRQYTDHEEIIALYRDSEFSIGMRLHSLIFSALTNVPVIALSYDTKTDEFMRSLGLTNLSIGINTIEAQKIQDCVNYILSQKAQIKSTLKTNIQQILTQRYDGGLIVKNKLKGINYVQ